MTINSLKADHAALARKFLLKQKVPIGALTAFFYRDFGFELESPEVSRVTKLFREEFGLADTIPEEQKTFDALFADDAASLGNENIELLREATTHG